MKKKYLLTVGLISLLAFAGLTMRRLQFQRKFSEEMIISGRIVRSIKVIKENTKSVDWSHRLNLITSEKKENDGYYDVFIFKPDGSDEECLTCYKQGVPQKHNGNPAWHPEGKYIVFTAEKEEVPKRFDRWAIPGTGLNCDLWLMTSDGERFYQLTELPLILDDEAKGTIHPQFSSDGKKLLWAERVGSGGAWGKWVLKVADFIDEEDNPHLTNIKTYQPGEQSVFYESHAFSKDSQKILFSGNLIKNQAEFGLDIYELDLNTKKLSNLTDSFSDWDEHAHYSPNGQTIAWMSSSNLAINWGDIKGHNWQRYIKTELWLMNVDGSNKQRLTFFNEPGKPEDLGTRAIVSDSAWSPDGKKILGTVAYGDLLTGAGSRMFLIELE